jgi:hypothetical protein
MAKRNYKAKPRLLLTVAVGQAELDHLCELSNGRVIKPAALLPELGRIDIETLIFDGHFVAVAKSDKRAFTKASRRAVQVRDRHCQYPSGCDC